MAGRKPLLTVNDELLEKVENLAAQGLTLIQIAQSLGIGSSTLYEYKTRHPELTDAHKKGAAKGIKTVTDALFTKAQEGDTTAMIFYLKNKAPHDWKDRKDVRQENVNLSPEQWLEEMADGRKSEGTGPEDTVQRELH